MLGKAVLGLATAAIVAAGSTLSASGAQNRGRHGEPDKGVVLKYSKEHPEIIKLALEALPSSRRREVVATVVPNAEMKPDQGGAYAMAIDKAGLAALKYLGNHPEIIIAALGALPFSKRQEVVAAVIVPKQ